MSKRQAVMRRATVGLAALAVTLMLAGAGAAGGQEVVLGFVGGFEGGCDGPGTPCNAGSGFIGVFGWALAESGVVRVEILIQSVQFPDNEITLGRAVYGAPRPDVTAQYPGFPDSAAPGWSYNINSTLFANGQYDVWARVITVDGSTLELEPKQVLFTNNQFVLRPFGEIERPGQNQDVFGTCDRAFCGDGVCEIGLGENCLGCPIDCNGQQIGAFDDFCCGYGGSRNPLGCDDPQPPPFPGDPPGALVCQTGLYACSDERQIRYAVVSGFALDLGINNEDTGISWVELETNGAIIGNTRTNCVFDRNRGGLTNCYGLPRIDLETRFPFAFDAPSAGYRFVMDVGAMLLANTVTLGSNELIVRAGDWSDQFEDIDRVSVNFFCAEDFAEEAFGEIESPREGRVYSGLVTFEGWALDGEGVDTVVLYIDGGFIANLSEGMGGYGPGLGTRPVVAADYPGYPDTDAPVWRLEDFDTNTLTNGFHTFQVQVIDDDGNANFIGGEVTFRVDNSVMGIRGLYK